MSPNRRFSGGPGAMLLSSKRIRRRTEHRRGGPNSPSDPGYREGVLRLSRSYALVKVNPLKTNSYESVPGL